MYTMTGSCPRCGAPIYTYAVWHAVTPPPSIYTCGCCNECDPAGTVTVSTTSSDTIQIVLHEHAVVR